jgi:hypothetical protein
VSIQKKPLEFFKKVVKLFSRISGEIFMLCNENYMVLKVLDMTETIVSLPVYPRGEHIATDRLHAINYLRYIISLP